VAPGKHWKEPRDEPGNFTGLLVLQSEALDDSRRWNCHCVFSGSIDNFMGSRSPVWGREGRAFLQRESSHVQGPRDDGIRADELDSQNRRAGNLKHLHSTPKAAFELEVAAGESAGVRLANCAVEDKLAAGAGTAAAINCGPGEVELATGLSAARRCEDAD